MPYSGKLGTVTFELKDLIQIFPPDDYYPAKIGRNKKTGAFTPKIRWVYTALTDRFRVLIPHSYQDIEKRIPQIHPFVLKRHLSVLWGHGIIEKWVPRRQDEPGKPSKMWGKYGRNPDVSGRIEVEFGEATQKRGVYWGVHYRWTHVDSRIRI